MLQISSDANAVLRSGSWQCSSAPFCKVSPVKMLVKEPPTDERLVVPATNSNMFIGGRFMVGFGYETASILGCYSIEWAHG